MPVRVVTDSTCDLPADLVAKYGITVVPLTVLFGDEALLDGVEIDAPTFYERLRTFHGAPRTSQPSVARFRETYEALAAETDEIVSIHISSRMSGTLNSASVAREAVAPALHVDLIDSYNVSLGLGAIVLEAAIIASAGAGLAEVAAAAHRAVGRVQVIAALDTLEYLRRGGRIGRARSLLGSILSIKPLLQVDQGELAPFERVRTRVRAVERVIELATADRTIKRLFVAAGGDDALPAAIIERVRPSLPHTEIIPASIGPAVGVHSGPGVFGFAAVRHD
jgi:DegV family protein with EDD domain